MKHSYLNIYSVQKLELGPEGGGSAIASGCPLYKFLFVTACSG